MLKKVVCKILAYQERTKKIYRLYKKARRFNRGIFKISSLFYEEKIYKRYHCIISSKAEIKENFKLPHPIGVIIGTGVKIGKNVTIYQNVTLGRKNKDLEEYPIIEDDVIIYSNSVILGNVTIGQGTVIGANSVVTTNTEKNSVYAGVPAKRINKRKDNNEKEKNNC